MRVRLIPFAFLGGLLAVAGCDSGPKIVKVSGTATHKGQPVPSLLLTFQPEQGRPSWGITDEKGNFTLEYDAQNKGAVVGKHTVTAQYRASTPDEEMKGTRSPAAKAVTEKYGDPTSSTLKIDITKAVDNLEVKLD